MAAPARPGARYARGEVIDAGQTLDRDTALRLYTAANGWFLGEESVLGTIEPGKYADVPVLSNDYFDTRAVSDEDIKRLTSVLTGHRTSSVLSRNDRLRPAGLE